METIAIGAEPAGHGAFVSGLERTLIDAASRPDLVGGYFPLAEALIACDPDPARLTTLAGELGASAALRRIGSLADQLKLEGLTGKLRPHKPPTSDLDLDPGLKEPAPFRDTDWWMRWPVQPKALAAELAQ